MKIGDMVENVFANGTTRYGIVLEKYDYFYDLKTNCYKVNFLPHININLNCGDNYNEYCLESSLKVISSVE